MADEKILGDWFRETPESLAMLESERERLAESEGRYAAQHPERATRYAEAIHSIVITDSPEQWRDLVDAVLAVADSELAIKDAENERLRECDRAEVAEAALVEARAQVEAVRVLHSRRPWDFARGSTTFGQSEYSDRCDHCHQAWPCETIAALSSAAADTPEPTSPDTASEGGE